MKEVIPIRARPRSSLTCLEETVKRIHQIGLARVIATGNDGEIAKFQFGFLSLGRDS